MALRPAVRLHMHRGHKLETAPSVEPVTAAEFKEHIRDDGMSDSEADTWIATARELIETNTGLAMITQVWELAMDCWPSTASNIWWDGVRQGAISELHGTPAVVELPRYPLQAVDAVTVYDESSDATSVVVADTFDVDTYAKPGRMALQSGATWPVAMRPTNAIIVQYTAGYGDTAADVPGPLKLAVKQVAAYMYEHRGDGCSTEDALNAASGFLGQYKVREI